MTTDYHWRTITSRSIIGQSGLPVPPLAEMEACFFSVLSLFYYLVIRIRNRNVGFMRYWTFSQLPNFILVVPILVASIYGIYQYFYFYYWQLVFRRSAELSTTTISSQSRPARTRSKSKSSTDPDLDLELRRTIWENPEAAPFFLVHTITTLILLFASHTQIALRVSMGNPVLFWIVGALVSSSSSSSSRKYRRGGGGAGAGAGSSSRGRNRTAKWARRGIVWSCTWGAVSLVLWAGFYPPA